jgi:DNA repair photolyase
MSLPSSSLPLFSPREETPGKPRLIGIARLASEGESIREGHNVEYFTLESKSVLNRCVSGRGVPFEWTINPYRGCEFGCKYCYARYTHEFMEMRDGIAFEQKIFVKQHTAELLRQELRQVKPDESISIGAATDPYQPAERRYEITRGILEEFARHEGFHLGIITKSNLVLRDIDVMQAVARKNRFSVHMTITTLDVDLARILEPRAPRPDLRLEAIRKLSEAGLRVGMSGSPVLPGITDSPKQIESLVRAAAEAGAHFIFAGALFLKPCSAAVFLPFLEKQFPHLVANYKRRYQGRAFLPDSYSKPLGQLVARLREKYSLGNDPRRAKAIKPPEHPSGEQMGLF